MNRSAYQSGGLRFGHGFPMTPWVLKILIANFVVFMAIQFDLISGTALEWLHFGVPGFWLRPWTAVTYMFVHLTFAHIFMNMLALFFFGPPLEQRWGGRFFLKYYLITGLGGAVFSVLLYSVIGPTTMIGASGAIFGLLLAFALNWPDAKIYVYFVFPVPAKWFVGVLGAFTLLSTVRGSGGGVAHWAHLGGLVSGFVFLRYGERIGRWFKKMFYKEAPRHVKVERGGRGRAADSPSAPTARTRRRRTGVNGDSLDEVDRILDKIRETGMDSLTVKERAFLDEMSRQYKETRTH